MVLERVQYLLRSYTFEVDRTAWSLQFRWVTLVYFRLRLGAPHKRSQDLERSSIREPMTKLLQATLTHHSTCAQLKLSLAAAALRSESTEGKHWPLSRSIQCRRGVVALDFDQ